MKNRHKQISDRVIRLINVKPVPFEQTRFLSKISHEKILEAFEYWFDQTKMVFGEAVLIQKTQNLQDAGIDLSLYFPRSDMRIGIQVKSYGDIQKKDFSSQVPLQIFESEKHGLSKILLALAGDLTDKSQEQKVRRMISEILQHKNNDYVLTIPPERIVNIFNAYQNNDHPSKFVLMDVRDAAILSQGIVESLSNKDNKVKIQIKIKNMNVPREENTSTFSLQSSHVDYNELSKVDDIRNIPVTDEVVHIDDNEIYTIKDNKEHNASTDFALSDITVWEERPNRIMTIFQTISDEGKVIKTYQQLFDIQKKDNEFHFIGKDMNQPLKFDIHLFIEGTKAFLKSFVAHFDISGFNMTRALDGLIFYQSMGNSTRVRCVDATNHFREIFDIPHSMVAEDNSLVSELVYTIVRLENQTGHKFVLLPKRKLTGTGIVSTIREAKTILYILESKNMIDIGELLTISMTKNFAIRMLNDYKSGLTLHDLYVMIPPFYITFLDQNIRIRSAKLNLSKVYPTDDIDKTIKKIHDSSDPLVELELRFKSVSTTNNTARN